MRGHNNFIVFRRIKWRRILFRYDGVCLSIRETSWTIYLVRYKTFIQIQKNHSRYCSSTTPTSHSLLGKSGPSSVNRKNLWPERIGSRFLSTEFHLVKKIYNQCPWERLLETNTKFGYHMITNCVEESWSEEYIKNIYYYIHECRKQGPTLLVSKVHRLYSLLILRTRLWKKVSSCVRNFDHLAIAYS